MGTDAPRTNRVPLSAYLKRGNHIYVSGQVPFDAEGKLVGGDIGDQTEQVIDNLERVLNEAGASLADVVKTTVYLSDVKRDFAGMNETYARRFGTNLPTRSTVGAELAIDALIEVEAIAVVGGEQ
jgi:2-iminobutanoate/2-iminopropanoate deaminase